jgi:hypothetical protein
MSYKCKEVLYDLYINQKKTLKEIAAMFNCKSPTAIC